MASVSVYPRPKKQARDQDTTERLHASRVRNQKGANFQNLAVNNELQHMLRTYDSMKQKAAQSCDFEQRKFLQTMSRSTEHIQNVPIPPTMQPSSSLEELHKTRSAYPNMETLQNGLGRSNSDLDIDIRAESAENPDGFQRSGSHETLVSPLKEYAISSSMKIATSKGSFEACTGIDGLQAWMGKSSPKTKKSTKFRV